MAVIINTNADALKIQNTLTNSTNSLSKSMQRMSSGLKINSAADDAAGTVISARMSTQLDGNKICQNNVQNANALLSTAEGNLDVVLENVSRIRDLTLQAKNGTYSDSEIKAMQDEVSQRIAEINRISTSSKYSQLQLFGDNYGLAANGATFQVGANSDDDNVISADSSLFKSVEFAELAVKSNQASVISKITTWAGAAASSILDTDGIKAARDDAENDNRGKVYYNTDTGKFNIITMDSEGNKQIEEYTKAINFSDKTKTTATEVGQVYKDGGKYYIRCATGEATGAVQELVGYKGGDYVATANAKIFDTNDFDLTKMKTGQNDITYSVALDALDNAINNLTDRKSTIGSLGNRLNSALDTLTTQYTNLSSAKSIITDTDVASEASNYTQNQILQQVSTSLLTQANQAPSIALSLI